MTRSLTVWWAGTTVGRLALDRHGAMRFTYDGRWIEDESAPPISFSLPKRAESFSARLCLPFFEGLLPEGAQRDAVATALGVSPSNTFRLLAALGAELAGALTLLPDDAEPGGMVAAGASEPLLDDELLLLIETIRTRPFLAGIGQDSEGPAGAPGEGLRMSLAGAQSKLPVVLVDQRVALPVAGQPTTHILKPPIPDLDHPTENEAFAMRLASRMGLTVAPVRPAVVADGSYLLVERYDRRTAPDGRVERLHQEDFCQALGFVPQRKYASDGGPGFPECFELVRRVCTRPAVAVLGLLDAAIVHVLLGNADAHGKNYSLLRKPRGEVVLAPLYDLLSTVAYPRYTPRFAMNIAGRRTLGELRRIDWDRFARRCGMAPPFVRRRVRELCHLAHRRAGAVAEELALPGLGEEALAAQADLVGERASRLANTVR
ncbi:MAG: type II toxin-antitoxin system HipA family toxin [Gemmatimonadetes bacterium]|nr:type II toxin-antitoxin system HipA family toxin [Gemmatimonadota bacterium]MYC91094.1 type II toxin-antitoxin system HipA family toxin [Gemmatimonadota bacterium]MYG36420.1 type II toxin-antitoxin system HipA family toxin [Gemmatimonadota bacterium]